MSNFTVKDSGVREEYESGMKRDTQEGKPDYTLIHIPFLTRLAEHLGKGAIKYGEDNWKLADSPKELRRFRKSATRHLIQWLSGERDEDHAAAVVFNLMAAEYVKERLAGPKEYDILTVFWKSGSYAYISTLEVDSFCDDIREQIAFVLPGRHVSYGFEDGHWKANK